MLETKILSVDDKGYVRPTLMQRLRASHTMLTGFFATSPIWRWTVAGSKLIGLSTLIGGAITIGCETGRLLLLNDAALQSALDLSTPDNNTDVRATMLGGVVIGTAVTVWATSAMRALWRERFRNLPVVQRFLALAKFTLQLCITILLATIGGVLVGASFPAVLQGGELPDCVALAVGLVFLGRATYSIMQWVRLARAPHT